jgi:hypothetical protein
MPSLLGIAKKYGAQVVTPNATLPRLALETAHAVASGHAYPSGVRISISRLDAALAPNVEIGPPLASMCGWRRACNKSVAKERLR